MDTIWVVLYAIPMILGTDVDYVHVPTSLHFGSDKEAFEFAFELPAGACFAVVEFAPIPF